MESDVFKKKDFLFLESGGECLCAFAYNVVSHLNFDSEKLGEPFCNRLERKLRLEFTLRSAKM